MLSFQGACILNMLRDYLGADAFKSGIVQYLLKHSYKNTKNEDLWNSMASVSMVLLSSVWGCRAYYHVFVFVFCTLLIPLRGIMSVFYRTKTNMFGF